MQDGEEEGEVPLQTPQVVRRIFPENRTVHERPDSVLLTTVGQRDHMVPPGAALSKTRSTIDESVQSEPRVNVSVDDDRPGQLPHLKVVRYRETKKNHYIIMLPLQNLHIT